MSAAGKEEGGAVPQAAKSSWGPFLKVSSPLPWVWLGFADWIVVTTVVYRILQWRSGELDGSGEYSFPYHACFYANADFFLHSQPFILSVTSLTEYSGYWVGFLLPLLHVAGVAVCWLEMQGEHPEIFVAPAQEENPEKRALAVLKWFLSTLKQQYSSRNEKL